MDFEQYSISGKVNTLHIVQGKQHFKNIVLLIMTIVVSIWLVAHITVIGNEMCV